MNPEERLRELRDPDRWQAVRVPRSVARAEGRASITPARFGQLVAAFAIAIVVVAGLITGLVALHASAPPAATPGPTPSITSGPAAPPSFSPVPGAKRTYSDSVVPPVCALAHLRTESKQDGGGAMGSYIQAVFVLNTGPDCLLPADAVRVGGAITSIAAPRSPRGLVLPSLALGRVMVTTEEACQPGGTKANIDPSTPELPIMLAVGGLTRTMTARFPQGACARPSAEAYLDDPGSAPVALTRLVAEVDQPSPTPRGALRYDVSVGVTGSTALVLSSCPVATEVLSDGLGAVITRAFSLRCSIGRTLEPDAPVTVPVSTTIPAKGDWTIAWYLGGGAGASVASSTCTLDQLTVSEPGPGGASMGNWVQLVGVRNRGAGCMLPISAFGAGGRVARAAQSRDAGGLALAAGSTTRLAVEASSTCADGSMNIRSLRSLGPDAKPVTLELGGRDAGGLDEPFPRLSCAGPLVQPLR